MLSLIPGALPTTGYTGVLDGNGRAVPNPTFAIWNSPLVVGWTIHTAAVTLGGFPPGIRSISNTASFTIR